MCKKFFALALCIMILACSCAANAEGLKIGILAKSETGPTFNTKSSLESSWLWSLMGHGHGENDEYISFEDLPSMIMALESGKVDELDLPQIVGEYIMAQNPNYKVSCVMRPENVYFAFGFLKEKNVILWQNFNYALRLMRRNGTLQDLQAKYLYNPGKIEPEPVKFDLFPNAQKVKFAVTGDIPPIDYTAPDGTPAGFNAALLAEIGRLLKINIEIINVTSGAKTAALTSGRADGVFWYVVSTNKDIILVDNDILLTSDPYYTFNIYMHIRKK
ncbi:MAG: transporter substrate-binding domain-containing protein [Synergistaceae bacterium]|nr:transporter substrate-binding domain-containing protein [Synergistaceae bacterium]